MTLLAKIHMAKKQLGLEDEDFRTVCERVTGERSTRAMSEKQRIKLISHLEEAGFKPAFKGGRKALEGRFAKKLQALWISAYNLGVVRNKDDKALLAFVKRQTGIDHVRFLQDAADAARAVEALKSWLNREADVDWTVKKFAPAWSQDDAVRIALAQWKKLETLGHAVDAGFAASACTLCNRNSLSSLDVFTSSDWQKVMNAWGKEIRSHLNRKQGT